MVGVQLHILPTFQHTAARRRLEIAHTHTQRRFMFQHTAARRRLVLAVCFRNVSCLFQHTAARRRLVFVVDSSRRRRCFNTQPPEGGWDNYPRLHCSVTGFNTQPPEGGWVMF